MAHHEENHDIVVQPANKEHIKKIWKTALILAAVTALEFLLAFTMERGPLLISIYVGLTIIKAFYIVAEFMHLRHESKTLIWSILIPTIFVFWLIVALLMESDGGVPNV
ncbi:cytochrome C oxidase subunit IV family protein [Nafulsella turpanensis]|uniref:cytochrome C oxidase subunit IV family protein n=1 Tax=Nafulsella turpanensis TaxID=1265690 RepID=UPI00034CA1CE|nr:cytochrome C oxidase subunit IV family protein [Nafulsella turpanensis]